MIDEPVAFVYADDQALHVSSGVSVLPDRVNISILLSGGTVAKWVKLTPAVWDYKTGLKEIRANYSPSRAPTEK